MYKENRVSNNKQYKYISYVIFVQLEYIYILIVCFYLVAIVKYKFHKLVNVENRFRKCKL